ncbi:MAG TPA: GIY-YIG nuclease family protein [Candidatus Andersenbacteria bacterium]|nr:GIY-YIG nuclease family protein [Candidatus Andersenbacteria bacterium]
MQHYVYAIYNPDHLKVYIGETNDPEERLKAHNEHRFTTSYTARFSGLWKLIYIEKCSDRREARKREKQLKSYQGRQFIKKHIPW